MRCSSRSTSGFGNPGACAAAGAMRFFMTSNIATFDRKQKKTSTGFHGENIYSPLPRMLAGSGFSLRRGRDWRAADGKRIPEPFKGDNMIAMTQRAVLHTLAVAALVACGAAHADGKYVLISHAPDSDSWWNTIKNAVKEA